MNRSVLLIGENKGFMTTAIVNGLKNEGYEVLSAGYSVSSISKITKIPKVWLVYMDKSADNLQETLIYIRDCALENNVHIYIIGDKEEISIAEELISKNVISFCFERPIDIKALAAEMDVIFTKVDSDDDKMSILIIDDDPAMNRTIKNLLANKYIVYMANSGMNGITFLAKKKVDLILLDYEMPVISGATVLEMLRSDPQTADIPVMFLTSKNDKESVMSVVSFKPEKYLLKSMPPREWIHSIDEFFIKRKF